MLLLFGLFSGNSPQERKKALKAAINDSYKIEKISSKAVFQSEKLISHLVSFKGNKALKRIKKLEASLDKILVLAKKLQDVSNPGPMDSLSNSLNGLECSTSFMLVHAEFGRRSLRIVKSALAARDVTKAVEATSALRNSFGSIRAISRSLILELVQGPETLFCRPV